MDKVERKELLQAISGHFECQRCGHCCKGDGQVRFGVDEAHRMADHLGLKLKDFLGKYALKIGPGRYMLKDRWAEDHETGLGREQWCVHLFRGDDGRYGCCVNNVKPDQCESFPYKWRNADSFRTCAGLRLMGALLRAGRQSIRSD